MTRPIDIGTQPPPIAIGGIGGSGTRLAADAVRALGVHIGDDLNHANDALWFTLLFKRREILCSDDAEFDLLARTLVAGLRGGQPLGRDAVSLLAALSARDRPQHPAAWLRARAESLLAAARRPLHDGVWGWKEPNTFMVVRRLWQRLPTLRYIHVVRHGLDMACSNNQNQLSLWGPHVLGTDGPITPARSLAYWCRVHRCLQNLLACNRERMFWFDYDAFCRDPESLLERLRRFLGSAVRADKLPAVEIRRPPLRHARLPIEMFAADDIDYVRSLGYEVPPASKASTASAAEAGLVLAPTATADR